MFVLIVISKFTFFCQLQSGSKIRDSLPTPLQPSKRWKYSSSSNKFQFNSKFNSIQFQYLHIKKAGCRLDIEIYTPYTFQSDYLGIFSFNCLVASLNTSLLCIPPRLPELRCTNYTLPVYTFSSELLL